MWLWDQVGLWMERSARYGVTDIILSLGIIGYAHRLLRKTMRQQCRTLTACGLLDGATNLHGRQLDALRIVLTNTGATNLFISRAYFIPHSHPSVRWIPLLGRWGKSQLSIYRRTARIAEKEAYALHFQENGQGGYNNLDVMIRPGVNTAATTILPLNEKPDEATCAAIIENKQCGTLVVEYAEAQTGRVGQHRVRL